MSRFDGFVNCAIFRIVVLCKSFAKFYDTVTTGRSFGMAFGVSSLLFRVSLSMVSYWSVLLKWTGSSCAMSVDSMFTSFGFVCFLGLSFQKCSFLNEIKNLLPCSIFLECVQW